MNTIGGFARVLGTAAVFASAACGAPSTTPVAATAQPTAVAQQATAVPTIPAALETGSFDVQFIDMMVPHHQGAVEMARIAQSRAYRSELKAIATDIITGQAAEIERMRAWRMAWAGSDQTPPMELMPMLGGTNGMGGMSGHSTDGAQTMDMAKDVEALRTAPDPFEGAFIDAMIPHHQSGVDAARLAVRYASHPEIKELAAAIIEAQLREISQMRAWRAQWYGSTGANTIVPTQTTHPAGQAEPTTSPTTSEGR